MSTVPVPPLIPGSANLQTLEVGTAKITSIVGDVMSTLNSWKGSVTAASTANVATLSGSVAVDGVTLVAGDTVLLKNQTTGSQNGIYLINSTTWTRNENLIAGSNAAGVAVFVNEGTTNADTIWVCTDDEAAAVVGTDALTFATITSVIGAAGSDTQVQFNSSGALAGDAGLTYNAGTDSLTVVGSVIGGTLTDGALSSTSGTVTGGVAATFSGAVTAGTLTDGALTSTAGTVTGGVAATFSGAVTGGSFTDGTATLTAGALSGVTNLTTTGNTILGDATTDTLGFYGVGPIAQGAAVTPGSDAASTQAAVNAVILRLQAYGLLA